MTDPIKILPVAPPDSQTLIDMAELERRLHELYAVPQEILDSPPSLHFSRAVAGPMVGRFIADFTALGATTHRLSSVAPNYSAGSPLPEVGIVLEQCGRRWRLGADVGNGGRQGRALDRRPFASRQAALKYFRKLWPFARVELASYGLHVRLRRWDAHGELAVRLRCSRAVAKIRTFWQRYGTPGRATLIEVDFEEISRRAEAFAASIR